MHSIEIVDPDVNHRPLKFVKPGELFYCGLLGLTGHSGKLATDVILTRLESLFGHDDEFVVCALHDASLVWSWKIPDKFKSSMLEQTVVMVLEGTKIIITVNS